MPFFLHGESDLRCSASGFFLGNARLPTRVLVLVILFQLRVRHDVKALHPPGVIASPAFLGFHAGSLLQSSWLSKVIGISFR